MKKPSIKRITVRNLTNLLIASAIVLFAITGYNFRALSQLALENQALAHADLVRAGLTAHMKAGVMDKRDYYLEEIRELHQIDQLTVIRGEHVTRQYGPGKDHLEGVVDDVTRQAFDSMESVFVLDEFSMRPTVRVIVPYIASAVGNLNCLTCHQVVEGTVLGAVDIQLDVSDYRNQSLLVMMGILGISALFLMLILVNTSRTIQAHVKAPLENLIKNAEVAYHDHKPLSPEQFATEEFTHVANEINLFNSEVIAHQDMLRMKNTELISLNDEIESTLRETVYTMGVIEETRSKETKNHTKRVSMYSQVLARKFGLDDHFVDLVGAASPLHDIGKLGIPDGILFKQGKLDENERLVMENHTRIGFTMLSHSERDILKAAGVIALQHHEKWDGSGYPQGLKGEDIHILGRIVALADVYDALLSKRVYKEAWELEQVMDWIIEQKGKHFDPGLVDAFQVCGEEFVKIGKQYSSETGE